MSITGQPGGPPTKAGVPVSDIGCALFALYGIFSALMLRNKTGRGQYVDASLFEAAIAFSIWDISEFWGTGQVPAPLGTANRFSAPYQAVRAQDGYFVLGANSNRLWQTLCDVLERPDLAGDSRFATIAGRLHNRTVLIEELEKSFAARNVVRMGGYSAGRRNPGRADPQLRASAGERAGEGARSRHGIGPSGRRTREIDRISGEAFRNRAARAPPSAASRRTQ